MKLRPGELLLIQRIAKELDVSRTPVREALARLRQEELVVPASGRKMKVSEFSAKDILEIYEVREGLERMAARLATVNINDSYIIELKNDLKELQAALQTEDYDKFFEEDANFHHHILKAANNTLLEKMLNGLDGRIQRIRYLTLLVEGRLENTILEHELILEKLINKDEIGAANAMETHLTLVKKEVCELLNSNNNIFSMSWLSQPIKLYK